MRPRTLLILLVLVLGLGAFIWFWEREMPSSEERAEQAQFDSERLSDQVRQTLANILAVLAEAGGKPEHIVRLTWFITSRDEYLAQQKEIGEAYRAAMGRVFPPMSVVQVAALIERQAKVEIEATAVIPD